MTAPLDLLFGAVSIALGAVLLLSGLMNWESAFQYQKTQWLESRWGRRTARIILAALGAVLIVLGVATAVGIRLW